jgi:hypothetical protein
LRAGFVAASSASLVLAPSITKWEAMRRHALLELKAWSSAAIVCDIVLDSFSGRIIERVEVHKKFFVYCIGRETVHHIEALLDDFFNRVIVRQMPHARAW